MDELQYRIYSNEYADIMVPYRFTTPERFLAINADYFPQIINSEYAILHFLIPPQAERNLDYFRFSYTPNTFIPLDTVSLEASGILRVQNQPVLNLSGKGVLMGFIDTGINYMHPAFRTLGGQTRILRIWDQSIPSPDNSGPFGYGTEYTQQQINQAIQSDNPEVIVPSMDYDGHGTLVAGAAAGSPVSSEDFIGAAYNSTIAVVKLKEAKQHLKDFYFYSGTGPVFQETDIMTGVQYLVDLSRQMRMPLVICIAIGSNQGEHIGLTPLDISLRALDALPGIAVISAAGNEGGRAHHFRGTANSLEMASNVEILVRENTPGFFVELWGSPPNLYSVGFRSPVGSVIPRIPARLQNTEFVRLYLEETSVYVYYELIQNTSGNQFILIRFERPTPGIWQLQVYNNERTGGEFDVWLPISGFIEPDVTFPVPDPYTTITTPANSQYVITPGAYDAYTGSLFLNTGRGYSRNNHVKPDISAPGVSVSGPDLRDGFRTFTGTSAAAALTSGSAALLMEWGQRNNPGLNYSTNQIKNFLIRGANRSSNLTYPNRDWGYGTLDVYQVFQSIS